MKIYDISVPINEKTPVYEGDPTLEIEIALSIKRGDAANVSKICMSLHTGTHIDAPNHFIEGAKRVDEISFEKLIGSCRVVELADGVMAITARHVENLENVERILFKTRNSKFWNDSGQGFRTDFTYIAPEAARVLAEKNISLVGLDYLSVEKFGAEKAETHLTLLEKEIVILEGADLREVPPGDYEIFCLPIKFAGGAGDGAPARVILRQ